jgi:hypothetical protein
MTKAILDVIVRHYTKRHITIELGYNDIGLYDTSFIASDILWYQLIPHCSTIKLHESLITTLFYNDTNRSVPFMTLYRVRLYIEVVCF